MSHVVESQRVPAQCNGHTHGAPFRLRGLGHGLGADWKNRCKRWGRAEDLQAKACGRSHRPRKLKVATAPARGSLIAEVSWGEIDRGWLALFIIIP